MANGDGKSGKVTTAILTILATLAGAAGGQFLDLLKTTRVRQEESRARAAELAWTQTAETFQKLFGYQAKLRADLSSFREFEIKARYYDKLLKHRRSSGDEALYTMHLKLSDEYARRVVEDRADVQALLGWIDYMLPRRDAALASATKNIVELSLWYAPVAPENIGELDEWLDTELRKSDKSARDEIETKFAVLLDLLRARRDELLHAPSLRHLRQLNESS
jgi:hypothetical protein